MELLYGLYYLLGPPDPKCRHLLREDLLQKPSVHHIPPSTQNSGAVLAKPYFLNSISKPLPPFLNPKPGFLNPKPLNPKPPCPPSLQKHLLDKAGLFETVLDPATCGAAKILDLWVGMHIHIYTYIYVCVYCISMYMFVFSGF